MDCLSVCLLVRLSLAWSAYMSGTGLLLGQSGQSRLTDGKSKPKQKLRRRLKSLCPTVERCLVTSDKGGGTCFCPCLFVCLSDCLSVCARLLKNTCVYLDEMLRVDRCRDMDELIKLLSPIRIIVLTPEPDCFLRYRIGYGTLQHCLGCQRAALLRGILRRENPTYTYWRCAARASRGFKMVLITEPPEDLCRR